MLSFDYHCVWLATLLSEPITKPVPRRGYRHEYDSLLLRKLETAIRNRDMHIRWAADVAIADRASAAALLESHLRTALAEVFSTPSMSRSIAASGLTLEDKIEITLSGQLDGSWLGFPTLVGLEDDPACQSAKTRFNTAYHDLEGLVDLHEETRRAYDGFLREIRRAQDCSIPGISERVEAFHAQCVTPVVADMRREESSQSLNASSPIQRGMRSRTSQKWTGSRAAAAR